MHTGNEVTMTPHKHAEWIKLYADGYSLEWLDKDNHWHKVTENHAFNTDADYRVALITELPRSTIEALKSWTEGFFECMSNLEEFDFDYWTSLTGYLDINVYNGDESCNPKIGQWSVHLMQGYPGCIAYQDLVSLGVAWRNNSFKILETTYFVGVNNEL